MKIAIFSPTLSGMGGMETAIRNLMAGFEALHEESHLFLFGGCYNNEWLGSLPNLSFGSPQDSRFVRFAKYALGSISAIRRWNPDVIVCADTTTLKMACLGRSISGHREIPIVSWVHFPLAEIRMKEALCKADLHLAISSQIAAELRAYMPEQANNITITFNALPCGEAFICPRSKSAVFLYVGRLTFDDHKRVNDILLAVSKLRGEWRLKIIGTAPLRRKSDEARLRKLACDLGIDSHVEWFGWQSDPWKAAGEVSALVSSSAREAFGMVLIEACSHGVPSVSSDCLGPKDIIEPGINGWLYPAGDADALALRLQLIVDDPSILPPAAEIQTTVSRFSAEAVARRVRDAIMRHPSMEKRSLRKRY